MEYLPAALRQLKLESMHCILSAWDLSHPHAEYHHIKKENIGLIEVMGLAVLPSRLKEEMELLAEYITEKKDLRSNEKIEKHADWAEKFLPAYTDVSKENIMDILQKGIDIYKAAL